MICKSCSIAGELVTAARGIVPGTTLYIDVRGRLVDIPAKEAVRSVAHLYHGLCKGCDCQHKIDFEGKLTVNAKR